MDASSVRFWFFAGNISLNVSDNYREINRLIHIIQIPILLLTDHKMFFKVMLMVGLGSSFSCHVLEYQLYYKKPFLFRPVNPSPEVFSVRGIIVLGLYECWRENFLMLF